MGFALVLRMKSKHAYFTVKTQFLPSPLSTPPPQHTHTKINENVVFIMKCYSVILKVYSENTYWFRSIVIEIYAENDPLQTFNSFDWVLSIQDAGLPVITIITTCLFPCSPEIDCFVPLPLKSYMYFDF